MSAKKGTIDTLNYIKPMKVYGTQTLLRIYVVPEGWGALGMALESSWRAPEVLLAFSRDALWHFGMYAGWDQKSTLASKYGAAPNYPMFAPPPQKSRDANHAISTPKPTSFAGSCFIKQVPHLQCPGQIARKP